MTQETASRERGAKRVPLVNEVLAPLLSGNATVVGGLPDDITIERVYNDIARDQFVLIVTSEEFEPVPEGDEIPVLELTVQDHYTARRLSDSWRQEAESVSTPAMANTFRKCADQLEEWYS